jgi:Acyl-CoA carboxylase epsilon subunit
MTRTGDSLMLEQRPLVQVEKGTADAEELAAVTAVLLARHAERPPVARRRPPRTTARWLRLERVRGFRAPHSWHD